MRQPKLPVDANILVTGAAGFIGSHFSELLFQSNHVGKVLLLDRLSKGGQEANVKSFLSKPNFQFLEEDICNPTSYSDFLTDCDFIFHFAAESHVDRSIDTPDIFIESNILGTFRLLEASRGIPGLRFVMISTDEVYGSNHGEPNLEEDSFAPSSIYSASKASAELLCLANHKTHSQDVVIIRSCNNFGPRQDLEKFIPTVITKILEGKSIPVYGTGRNIREWIDVRENVKAITAIAVDGKQGEAYNVGSEIRLENLEMINAISKFFDVSDIKLDFVEDRKGHDSRYALNSNKLRNQLNWNYEKKFNESIYETINWYKSRFSGGIG
jgi:dTDP-glucose 4,6-dehydratase